MFLANLGLLATMLIWGAFIPALNLVFVRWDPWSLAVIRYWIALPLLGFAIRLGGTGPLLPSGLDWRRLALVVFPLTFRKRGEPLTPPNDRHGDPNLKHPVGAEL